jgi:hypothetical protein
MVLNLNTKGIINSFFLSAFFLVPYTISGNIDPSEFYKLYTFLSCFYFGLTIYLRRLLLKKEHQNALFFTFILILFGTFNQIFNGYISFFNIISPFIAYIGYVYTIKYDINVKVFILLMILTYIYFIILFFSLTPIELLSLYEVPDEDDNFINSSTNIIPCVLINTLYAIDIINKVKNNGRYEKIIISFAIINVILILIQKSRAGIIVSIFYLLFKLVYSNKNLFWIFMVFVGVIALKFSSLIIMYLDTTGGMTNYSEDARGINLALFFNNMNFISFIFGYGNNLLKLGQEHLTMSMFISIWNYYGLFALLFLLLIIAKRFLITNKNMVPPFYFLPFIIYAFFETFFFPNFWDFSIYLVLFYEKKYFGISKNKKIPQVILVS